MGDIVIDEKTRVKKDIIMFKENIQKVSEKARSKNNKILELACQYYKDSKYYLGKKDYFTAFGCINYAHGLLDVILKF